MVKMKPTGMLCRGRVDVVRDGNNRVDDARKKKIIAIFLLLGQTSSPQSCSAPLGNLDEGVRRIISMQAKVF